MPSFSNGDKKCEAIIPRPRNANFFDRRTSFAAADIVPLMPPPCVTSQKPNGISTKKENNINIFEI